MRLPPRPHRPASISPAARRQPWLTGLVAAVATVACTAGAQVTNAPPAGLAAAAQQALQSNPEVTASFNAFHSAAASVDAARGGWLPRLDLEANAGRTRDRINTRAPRDQSITQTGIALSVRQLLWDGLATSREVDRRDHEKLARYFEFRTVSEDTVLEVARAWYDVVRYRQLVALAEDNYVQHRYAFSQIDSRVRAGVGRGVDLEQSAARLALAESNLTTETANLHDVSARYLRLVGAPPPATAALPEPLTRDWPASPAEAVNQAVAHSPAVSGSVETLRAARASVAAFRGASLQPQVEARLRSGTGRNFDGVPDQRRDTTAEITLAWNLYKGGSDQATIRQHTRLLTQAEDLRDKTCRDTRQTAAIAYNDARRLTEQIGALERNVAAILRTRDAYRQQFDIGQRSLLDLLNAENEVYSGQRALANARYDLGIAQARTQSATGRLTGELGLTPLDAGPDAAEAQDWSVDGDAPLRCPPEVIAVAPTPRSALDARAEELVARSQRPGAAPAPAPAPAPTPAPRR